MTLSHLIHSSDERFAMVRERVSSFLVGVDERPVFAAELTLIAEMLESLPLRSDVYELASQRLRNARHYMDAGEFGAAQYELRLLPGNLTPQRTAEPNRRRR